jgi:CxxC motif-containing protein (DUF1111 family)
MLTRNRLLLLLLPAGLYLWAQLAPTVAPRPGDPLPGISPAERILFNAGREDFLEVEDEADGLGPAYNATSCAVCHNLPAVGGGGHVSEIRAGTLQGSVFTPPANTSLIHLFSIPEHQCQPQIPRGANVVARRIPIPVFGDGLIEAIPDATIRALEDPQDRNFDGISGRAAQITDVATNQQRIGRFGWKAQQASLLAFSGDAYRNEMGITNDLFRDETAAGLTPQQLAACDKVRDPEDAPDSAGRRGIDNFTNFMRLLAPVARGPITPDVQRGENVFASLGCARCHVPVLSTGPSSNPLFDRKPVPLYSDLLLHKVGTGDGIAQGAARPEEIRTPPLWGLRLRKLLLHDGRAESPAEAIERHGGEALFIQFRYRLLPLADRQALLAFLESL